MALETLFEFYNKLVKRASEENWTHLALGETPKAKNYKARLDVIKHLFFLLKPDDLKLDLEKGPMGYELPFERMQQIDAKSNWRYLRAMIYLSNVTLHVSKGDKTLREIYPNVGWLELTSLSSSDAEMKLLQEKGILMSLASEFLQEFKRVCNEVNQKNDWANAKEGCAFAYELRQKLAILQRDVNALVEMIDNFNEITVFSNIQTEFSKISRCFSDADTLNRLCPTISHEKLSNLKQFIDERVLDSSVSDMNTLNLNDRLNDLLGILDETNMMHHIFKSDTSKGVAFGSSLAGVGAAVPFFGRDGLNLKSNTFEALLTDIAKTLSGVLVQNKLAVKAEAKQQRQPFNNG